MRSITGSALPRVIPCPGSERLPHIKESSVYADNGTARHSYLQGVSEVGATNALAAVPDEYREICEAIDLTDLPTHLAAEVTFAFDVRTGKARELGRCLGRDYSAATEYEIVGTIDVLGFDGDCIYIGDYKGYEYVSARDNPQLLFAALCATLVYPASYARLEIINLRDGEIIRNSCTVDCFEIAAFRATLIKAVEATQQAGAVIATGDHCRYCPAWRSCPAKVAVLRELVSMTPDSQAAITEANAYDAYAKYLEMRGMMKKVSDAIHAYAGTHTIDLGNGRVFGKRTKQGNEKLDGGVVYEVLKAQHSQEVAESAVEMHATKKSIAAAVRASEAEGTQKALNEEVLTAVRAKGGGVRKSSVVIDEHKGEV